MAIASVYSIIECIVGYEIPWADSTNRLERFVMPYTFSQKVLVFEQNARLEKCNHTKYWFTAKNQYLKTKKINYPSCSNDGVLVKFVKVTQFA